MLTHFPQPKTYGRRDRTRDMVIFSLIVAAGGGAYAVVKMGWGPGILAGLGGGVLCLLLTLADWPDNTRPQEAILFERTLTIKYPDREVTIDLDQVEELLNYVQGGKNDRAYWYGAELKDGNMPDLFIHGMFENEADLLASISQITGKSWPRIESKWTKWGELPR